MLVRTAKRVLKAVGSPVIDAFGVYQRRIERLSARPGSWTIMMYHRVIDDPAADPFRLGMCVQREHFAEQVAYMSRHFTPIAMHEAAARIHRGEPLPPRALSITFDDGYLDNLSHALPILEQHGVPHAIYVPTGGLDSGEMLWWDRVIGAFACTERKHLDLQDAGLADHGERVSLNRMQRPDVVARVLGRLWDLPAQRMLESVRRIERLLAARLTEPLVARRLSPEQVVELHRHGVEIGAHSIDHPNLALASAAETRREMQEGRDRLQQLLQHAVCGLAYPGGRMGPQTAQIARELGFSYALATYSGGNQAPHRLYELSRIGMPDTHMPDFRRAVSVTLGGSARTSPLPTF